MEINDRKIKQEKKKGLYKVIYMFHMGSQIRVNNSEVILTREKGAYTGKAKRL